jgi:hypothetical protein
MGDRNAQRGNHGQTIEMPEFFGEKGITKIKEGEY